MAIFYTTNQKIVHLRTWVTSGQQLMDYCKESGVSRSSMTLWTTNILGVDYTSSLRNAAQKALKKIERMEVPSFMGDKSKSSSSATCNGKEKQISKGRCCSSHLY